MRILLVSQMYPSSDDPDLGVFVQQLERGLRELGHGVELAVLEGRGGGRRRHLTLVRRASQRARVYAPDVVYAHFLFPAGMAAALAARRAGAPLVVTAHGRDVRNIGVIPGVGQATRWVMRRASSTIVVSQFLRRELQAKLAQDAGEVHVIDCGVDLSRFDLQDPVAARRAVGWDAEGPRYLHVGTLDERKNVLRLADAFASLAAGSLAFVGDGPLRSELEGRPGVKVVGRVPHEEVSSWIAAADVVCQPSLVEPFGLAILEAMAAGRTVVATRIGGPVDFVPPQAGILIDPLRVEEIASAMVIASTFPAPNVRSREAAARHDFKLQAERIAGVLKAAIATRQ